MPNQIIEQTIVINAPADKVWSVFTEPSVTRKMGGEYVTDWKEGSSIGWKGSDGKLYTQGTILQLEQNKLIRHNLLDLNKNMSVLSEISYDFQNNKHTTILFAREKLNYEVADDQLKDANEGWIAALKAVKDIAETL